MRILIFKALLESNIGRVQVEFYKEIKKVKIITLLPFH